jgi:cytochrome c peroxidase
MNAISSAAKRGEILFSSSERAGCFRCHGGWNFSAVRFEGSRPTMDRNTFFFNTGVSAYEPPNRGIYEYTARMEDIGKFRVPTLRNIALTAPYMHDGSLRTLEEVIDHYAAGGRREHANKSKILRKLDLTEADKRDLIEFLKSLTDEELFRDPRWSDPWQQRKRP